MKKILVIIVFMILVLTCKAELKYKGYLNVGGSVMSGDTYTYVMGCDGKIGLSLSTEHGIVFGIREYHPDGIFFGGGIGFDYVNVALSNFNEEEYKTTNVLSNSVMAVPMYLTIKYICNIEKISMVYAVRGGYYKWFRGHIIDKEKELEKDYDIPYRGGYTLGFGLGVRFPINDRKGNNQYGVNLMFNYDYMGANIKWQDENISNYKVGLSIGFDF